MDIDIYDTYATDRDGSLMHIDVVVPAGTSKETIIRIVREHVGAADPEIETEKRRARPLPSIDPTIISEARSRGFSIVPVIVPPKAAA